MLSTYIILFMGYSFIGWICEIGFLLIEQKKIANRGFLIGPYCPIYGFGCLLLSILLSKYINEPFALFALSMIICAILEYFTSWLMEKIFKMRWWDYTHYKFNINGRICLETMIPFGLAGVLIVRYINPFFMNIINLFSPITISLIATIFASIIIVDCIISFNIIFNLKTITKNLKKDSTEEIKKYVSKNIKSNKFMYRRLIKAFPSLKRIIAKSEMRRAKIKKKIRDFKKKKID